MALAMGFELVFYALGALSGCSLYHAWCVTRDGDQDGGSLGAGVNRLLLLMACSPPKELKCQQAVLRISMAAEGSCTDCPPLCFSE